MAGFVPHAVSSLVNGGYGSPAFDSVVPNASGGAIPVAGFPDPAGAPQGVAGLARGTCPINGSHVPAPPGGGAPPPGGPGAGTGTASGGQHRKVLMKLMTYDGSGSLETFLAKFSKLAKYMQWNDTDRYYHLCASLNGIAGQVLWDAGPQATVADVIGLLRTRFGNELQAERFKAELKVRRRRTGESLQQLYQDISKLVALAHPNEGPALVNHVAKKTFVIALGDPILQLKVIERKPKTVEDTLNIAVKMEAYQASVVPPELDKGAADHRAKHKVKSTYAVEGTEQAAPAGEDDMALIHKRLSQLQAECTSTREEIGRVKAQKEEAEKKATQATQAAKAAAQAAKSANPPAATGSAPNPGGGGKGFQQQRGGYRGRGRSRGNHRTGDCPNGPPPEQPAVPLVPAAIRTVSAVTEAPPAVAQAQVKTVKYPPKHGWLQVEVQDKSVPCMLDLDTQHTVISPAYVGHKRMKPSDVTEAQVNGKTVPVIGQ